MYAAGIKSKQHFRAKIYWQDKHAPIQREGHGVLTPMKNHKKNIGFLCNIVPDPLKITKLPSQHSMLGRHWHTSETPFLWCFAGGPMMAPLKWYLDPLSPHQAKKKTTSELDSLWQNFLDLGMIRVVGRYTGKIKPIMRSLLTNSVVG